jgi:hypothetical protein
MKLKFDYKIHKLEQSCAQLSSLCLPFKHATPTIGLVPTTIKIQVSQGEFLSFEKLSNFHFENSLSFNYKNLNSVYKRR